MKIDIPIVELIMLIIFAILTVANKDSDIGSIVWYTATVFVAGALSVKISQVKSDK